MRLRLQVEALLWNTHGVRGKPAPPSACLGDAWGLTGAGLAMVTLPVVGAVVKHGHSRTTAGAVEAADEGLMASADDLETDGFSPLTLWGGRESDLASRAAPQRTVDESSSPSVNALRLSRST